MIGMNDEGGYNVASLFNQGALKTLIGGGSNYSNLSIPYGLYSSNTLDYDEDKDENDDDDDDDDELINHEDYERDVVDDDIYDNLLALMDADNVEHVNTSVPSSIELVVAEISAEPLTESKKPTKSKNKSRKHQKSRFSIQKATKKKKSKPHQSKGRKTRKRT